MSFYESNSRTTVRQVQWIGLDERVLKISAEEVRAAVERRLSFDVEVPRHSIANPERDAVVIVAAVSAEHEEY